MLLIERLKKADSYEAVGGAAYLAEIGRQVPTAAHAEYYARIVADKAVLRSLIHAEHRHPAGRYDPRLTRARFSARPRSGSSRSSKTAAPGRSRRSREVLQESLDRIDARMDTSTPSAASRRGSSTSTR